MKKYHLLNNIIGWGICIIASLVFIMTAEPTTSWWDCGEYISTAYKLEVGHPPGAPTFQLIGRFFSMFAFGDVMKVAYAVNIMSALCSGFTILFLFWSITLLAKKIVLRNGEEMTSYKMWTVFASGVVGALAYTFSDTFWFSAVEGEVYAMSSFFTAIVFWVILKWEEQADSPHALRWLILIAFLIGLAIGVHLLNLLAIPAIVYIYYFKKYPKVTKKGMILAFILSMALVGGILYIIVPWIVILAGSFEVAAVNSLGLPFNSGTIIYFILLLGGITWGLLWSIRKKKAVWNTIILSFMFILIGYSSFFILVIRANSNTPLNENEPKDAVALRAYLGREQYGSRPLFYGNYYNVAGEDVVKVTEGYQKYVKGEDQYIPVSRTRDYVFSDAKSTIFPRMASTDNDRNHPIYYKWWTGIKLESNRTPTFGENLAFFFKYQVNYMYWRYFLWNFAGRQNDLQGEGFNRDGSRDLLRGNWITGIKFWDEARLGPQDNLPDDLASNMGRNKLYGLPLLLGLIGLVFHFRKTKRDTFVVFLLFFMTGLAIIIYLNEPPIEPRERDYTYAGSFYAFAIWIGLGVMAISDFLSKKINKMVAISATSLVCLFSVPVLMAVEEWDDHDRSRKYAARDFSENYMDSCEPNAILITYGDNDTFPLWFLQEVEGKHTDIRVLNYTLSGMYWYVEQLYNTVYESKALPFTLPKSFHGLGKDETFIQDRVKNHLELKDVLKLMASGSPELKARTNDGTEVMTLPSRRLKITLDIPKLVSLGIIPAEMADSIPHEIFWEIEKTENGRPSSRLYRHELMMLDLLATNGFERPIYFMNPGYIRDIFPPIMDYVKREGVLYRLMPYKVNATNDIEFDKTHNLLANKFKWGNLNAPGVYIDPVSMFQQSIMIRMYYADMANRFADMGRKEQAREIADKGLYYFPNDIFQLDRALLPTYAEAYYKIGDTAKGIEVLSKTVDLCEQHINYYNQFKGDKAKSTGLAKETAARCLYSAYTTAAKCNYTDLQKRIQEFLSKNGFQI